MFDARQREQYAATDMDVTVVGAGVIGLTTALVLEERGHRVRVIADAPHEATTSAVAGAVWFPYRAGPPDKVALWAARSREWLTPLASNSRTGVDLLAGYEITNEVGLGVAGVGPLRHPDDGLGVAGVGPLRHPNDGGRPLPRPWWAAGIEVGRAAAPVTGAPHAWTFAAPRCEPAVFMPWLAGQLKATIERRAVTSLAVESGDVVVNCTGLQARGLTHDEELVPLLGQVVITEIGGVDPRITVTDHRDVDNVFYVIPRRDELVLGGCTLPHEPEAPVPPADPAITARILGQAASLGLAVGAVRRVRVGLRPYRPSVRLERDAGDPRIVHNYGHGGAGYTLARGCAETVAALI